MVIINLIMSRELDKHGERVIKLLTNDRLWHPSGSNKTPGPFEKLLDKCLINSNTPPKHVVTQQAADVPRIILLSKEEKQSKAAPPNSSAELHQSLSSGPQKWLHIHAGMFLKILLSVLCMIQDLHSNLDSGGFTGWIQHSPDPVSPQKESLSLSHHCAAEGIGKVQLEAALHVSH